MKYGLFILLITMMVSCNVAKWNQQRLNSKFKRNKIYSYMYKSDSSRIHYYKGGNGKPLLLIHGFGGDAQITWQKNIIRLSKNHTVIAPDLLWFGNSSSRKVPSLQSQIEMILNLLNFLKIKDCAVVGVSYGGFVTLGLMQEQPNMFSKIGIVDCPGMTYNLALLDTMCKKMKVNEPADIFVPDNANEVKRLFNFAFYKDRNLPKCIWRDAYQLYFSKNHQALTQLIRTLPNTKEKYDKLPSGITPKIIVMWGENDQIFPLKEGEKLADSLNCKLKIIPMAGHAPMIEQPKKFNQILLQFLN